MKGALVRCGISYSERSCARLRAMEYVILRSVRPTWLTMQLPDDAAELLRYRGPSSHADVDRT